MLVKRDEIRNNKKNGLNKGRQENDQNILEFVLQNDTSTIPRKLEFQFLTGKTSDYIFLDSEDFFGTNLKLKYPKMMVHGDGDKQRVVQKFSILDEDGTEFRCVIHLTPLKIKSSSLEEKIKALSKDEMIKNLQELKKYFSHFEIIKIVDGVSIANQLSTYSDCYIENLSTDEFDRERKFRREYCFFYKKGFGCLQFYLDSRDLSKEELISKFKHYKPVVSHIANSFELLD